MLPTQRMQREQKSQKFSKLKTFEQEVWLTRSLRLYSVRRQLARLAIQVVGR